MHIKNEFKFKELVRKVIISLKKGKLLKKFNKNLHEKKEKKLKRFHSLDEIPSFKIENEKRNIFLWKK